MNPNTILSSIPAGLRDPLVKCYQEILSNYSHHKWEPSELNGGKFCEVVYTILSGYLSGTFASQPSKPRDMVAACRALETQPPNPSRIGDRSVRILIPRMLAPLYEIRNNRGVGHVGGDVDPNYLDATAVCSMSSWILAELVRIFHNVSTADAQKLVDLLIERKTPLIWEVGDIRRVLDTSLSKTDQMLLLLSTRSDWVSESDIFSWIEYSTITNLRTRILEPLHKLRMIEYDKTKRLIKISPLGAKQIEDKISQKNSFT